MTCRCYSYLSGSKSLFASKDDAFVERFYTVLHLTNEHLKPNRQRYKNIFTRMIKLTSKYPKREEGRN
jgi:hypothetical protein